MLYRQSYEYNMGCCLRNPPLTRMQGFPVGAAGRTNAGRIRVKDPVK